MLKIARSLVVIVALALLLLPSAAVADYCPSKTSWYARVGGDTREVGMVAKPLTTAEVLDAFESSFRTYKVGEPISFSDTKVTCVLGQNKAWSSTTTSHGTLVEPDYLEHPRAIRCSYPDKTSFSLRPPRIPVGRKHSKTTWAGAANNSFSLSGSGGSKYFITFGCLPEKLENQDKSSLLKK